MIYLQFVNEDWKFLVPKIKLPESCNNNNAVEFLNNIKPPKLKFFEISTEVNNPAKNDPSIINPVR